MSMTRNGWNWARRALALLITVPLAAAGVVVVSGASPAAADTGNYPYWNMPCEHSPYASSGPANYCANYDWGPKHTQKYNDPSEISPYGYAYRNCTDYVAWKLASLGVPASIYKGHGNGSGWAKVSGLTTNTTPAVGAVAVQTSGTFGHVAFITSVSGSTITVAEYNYGENGTYDTRSGTLSSLGFNKVTHFEKYENVDGGSGGYDVAFQANTGALLVSQVNSSDQITWTTNSGLGMMAGTSPAIAANSSGGYDVAFQANTGALLVSQVNSSDQITWTTNSGLGMMAGTSAAIAANSSGGYDVAFQANTGALLVSQVNSSDQITWTTNSGLGMMAGTSPAIVANSSGGYDVAFQANTGALLVSQVNSSDQITWTTNSGLGMMAGTSPAIAANSSGGYDVAFQANTGALLVSQVNSSDQITWTTNSGLGMMAGTSPAIAANSSGGYDVAFQANTGALLVSQVNSSDQITWTTNSGLGMMAGTSPADRGELVGGL